MGTSVFVLLWISGGLMAAAFVLSRVLAKRKNGPRKTVLNAVTGVSGVLLFCILLLGGVPRESVLCAVLLMTLVTLL